MRSTLRLVTRFVFTVHSLSACHFVVAEPVDKKLADNYYTSEAVSMMKLYGSVMILERMANAVGKGDPSFVPSEQNDELIDACQRLAKELGIETDVDWHLLRHYLGTRQSCTGCGYLNDVVQIQAQAVGMLSLVSQIKYVLNNTVFPSTCLSKCTYLLGATDHGDGQPYIGTDGYSTSTDGAGLYCLREYVPYTGTTAPALTIDTANTSVDFLDNTIKGTTTDQSLVSIQESNVVIKNGAAIGGGSSTNCLEILGTHSNITVQDMVLSGSPNGFGLYSDDVSNLVVQNVIADTNAAYGFGLTDVENGILENCIARENAVGGFSVDPIISPVVGLVIENCTALSNVAGPGFQFDETSQQINALVKGNIAIGNNTYGYEIVTGTPPDDGSVQLLNNFARGNTSGGYFNEADGSVTPPSPGLDYTPEDLSASRPFGVNISV